MSRFPIIRPALSAFFFAASPHVAADLAAEANQAWAVAEQRCQATVEWMEATYGSPEMFARYPKSGDLWSGRWTISASTGDWRAGFWPGTLWLLARKTGSKAWMQRAANWSAALAATTNSDHDIGFITLASLGEGRGFHDDLTDPAGSYRSLAAAAITSAAARLDARFNMPNASGTLVPAGFIRSWNSPYQDPYPVCVDNLMNLELLFLAYEINGRLPGQRVWFDHALAHARQSIARHLRPDGGTWHVVKHFENGPLIGEIERKYTVQGYGDETTWSRGQAWAVYGFTAAYRHASRDPSSTPADLLSAACAAADYFISHLPHHLTADPYNHRPGDFVPPSDFDASLGEPTGPWNDANDNYNPATGTGLGDRKPATRAFTLRDSSAAAIAAAGLLELCGYAPMPQDRARYRAAAEDILHCLITYDGPDSDGDPDYLCLAGETDHPGILKHGSIRWGDPNQSLIFGDYYFLHALARLEALQARELLAQTQRIGAAHPRPALEFEINSPAPSMSFQILKSPDLAPGTWQTMAAKTGAGQWSGPATTSEQALPDGRLRVTIHDPSPAAHGFFRILTRGVVGSGP